MNSNKSMQGYLAIIPSCVMVRGIKRSVIQDNTTGNFDLVPNELVDVVEKACNLKFSELLESYNEEDRATIGSYVDFLIDKGYAYFAPVVSDILNGGKAIAADWDTPFVFSNAIIDAPAGGFKSMMKGIQEIGTLGCDMLQLRFLHQEGLDAICNVLEIVSDTALFNGVSLVVSNTNTALDNNENIVEIQQKFPIVSEIIIGDAPSNNVREILKYRVKILTTTASIHVNSCGAIDPVYFGTSISGYAEAVSHNSCLNRKISIDESGNIKNCPSMKDSYGHIATTSIATVIKQADFTGLWQITKKEIAKCATCEFRFICTDCRAYLEDPLDKCSAPLKCGYDPHTTAWADWSADPLKAKAAAFYGL